LDWLKANNKKATFFVIGGSIRSQPDVLKRIVADGHEIGCHTWSHKALTTLTTEEVVAELQYTIKAIEEVTGVKPKYLRPPFGDFDDRIRAIAKSMGLTIVGWNWDSNDWKLNNGDRIPAGVMETSAVTFAKSSPNGGIGLQHDLTLLSSQRNPTVADALLNAGVDLVSMDECVGRKAAAGQATMQAEKKTTDTKTSAGKVSFLSNFLSFGLLLLL
jgi:peptidoglycan/xylan/chitin deacetylase (PgdA/CDA1 family)